MGLSPKIIFKYIIKRRDSKLSLRSGQQDGSSMADVSFLLLIFFIVTSSFLLPQGIILELPSKSSQSIQIDEKKVIEVYPEQSGYSVKNILYNEKKFSELLQNKIEKDPEMVFIVYMKKDLPYKRLIDTLDLAKKNKFKKFSLK